MAFPPEIPTRAISVGGAAVLESSTLLKVQVTVTASKSLVWDATGFRYERMSVTDTSELGSELVIPLPRTDVQGWRDAKTGEIIDVSTPGSYTHRYTAVVRFLDADNRHVAVSPVTLGPFVVPAGDGPIDLDKMVPASTVAGDTVNVPDWWGQLVAEAQAAADQAAQSMIDSDQFIADQIATPGTATATQLSATIDGAVDEVRQNVTTVRRITTLNGGANPMVETPDQFDEALSSAPRIVVSPEVARQQVTGVGAAVTDSSAYLLMTKLTKTQRKALLTELFAPGEGAFSWVRIALGGSDFNFTAQLSKVETFPATLTDAVAAGSTSVSTWAPYEAGDELVIDSAPFTTTLAAVHSGSTTLDTVHQFRVGETFALGGGETRTVSASTAIAGGFRSSFSPALSRTYEAGSKVVGVGAPRQEIRTVASVTGAGPYVATLTEPLTIAHPAGAKVMKRDPDLTGFSFTHEMTYLVPVLREILEVNPGIRILGAVWLSPSWMKNTLTAAGGVIRDEEFPIHAKYIVKLVGSFYDAGVPVHLVCPQNEPGDAAYSLTYYAPEKLVDLMAAVRAELDAQGYPEVKLQTHDSQWSDAEYAVEVLKVDRAAELVDSLAWHAYSGEATDTLPAGRLTKAAPMMTERRTLLSENWYTSALIVAADCVIGTFRAGGEASILWNLALDEAGKPTQGSTGRRGVVTIASDGSGAVTRFADYYALKHFSRFVKPGAVRVDSTMFGTIGRYGTDVQTVAFRNTDGSVVLYVFNSHPSASRTVQIVDDRAGAGFTVTLAAGELSTFVWGETAPLIVPELPIPPTPGPAVVAPSVIGTPASARDTTKRATSLTFTANIPDTGSNRVAVVIVNGNDGPEGWTWEGYATYGGIPMILGATSEGSASSTRMRRVSIYYLVNPPTGAQPVVVGTVGRNIITAAAFGLQNVDQVEPVTAGVNVSGTSTGAVSLTNPNRASTDLIIAAFAARSSATLTYGPEQTELAHQEADAVWMTATRQPGGAGKVSSFGFTPVTPPDAYAIASLAFHGPAT